MTRTRRIFTERELAFGSGPEFLDNSISSRYNRNMGKHLKTFIREELIDLALQLQVRVAELEARLVLQKSSCEVPAIQPVAVEAQRCG